MKKSLSSLFVILLPCFVYAQTTRVDSTTSAAQRQDITIEGKEAAKIPVHQPIIKSSNNTSDCLVATAGGVQFFGWGASLSSASEAEQCNCREDSKVMWNYGMVDDAKDLIKICSDKLIKKITPTKKVNNCEYPTDCEKRR